MDVGSIDYWANTGRSPLHRASAPAKLAATAVMVAAPLATSSVLVLLTIDLVLAAAIAAAGLPALRLLGIAVYPSLFALLFGLGRWDGSWLTPAMLVLRALATALATLLLIATTPYPRIFACLEWLLPRAVRDGLLITYRSLFLLFERAGRIWAALRLRGGLSSGRISRRTSNAAAGLGLLLLQSLTLSQRLYAVMTIRGYEGRFGAGPGDRPSGYDLYPLGLAAAVGGLVLAASLRPAALAAYLGFAQLAALVALVAALIRQRPGHRKGER